MLAALCNIRIQQRIWLIISLAVASILLLLVLVLREQYQEILLLKQQDTQH